MTGPSAFTCLIHAPNSAFQRIAVLQETWGQHCRKVSPITLILQYRFAFPKPLKACPEPWSCETSFLCNRVRVEIPVVCSSPLFLVNS